jgi:hypothetical protein
MRGCFKAFVAFGLVAALAGPVSAQGRGGFGGGGVTQLLANESVQKELKLDSAQIEKATALAAETREKMTDVRSKLEGLTGEELMAKRQELMKPINDEALKTAGTFLKPEQLTRVKQIELQQLGANALADPAIAKKLNVTDEQASKVKTILADSRSEMRELFQSAGDDRQAAMATVQALRKETNHKVMALMTGDQKKTWKEMTGEPFEVVFQPRNQ